MANPRVMIAVRANDREMFAVMVFLRCRLTVPGISALNGRAHCGQRDFV